MIFGSVCSGIEAASVAWHPLGWRAAFLSEIAKFPRAVLKHHYPETPLHGDFTTIEDGRYEPVDVLVAGTPCQSFSLAGLRGGLDDSRGALALEFLRLASRLRPRWLVWENVPGVLSHDGGRTMGTILRGLGELGYGWAYRSLDAQHFGLAQRRGRVFVVGYLGDWRRAAAVLFEHESLSGHPAPRRGSGPGVARSLGVSTGGASAKEQQYTFVSGEGDPLNALEGDVARALNGCHTASGRMDASVETFVGHDLAPTLDASFGRLQGASGQDLNHGHGHLVGQTFKASHFTRGKDGAPSDLAAPLSAEADKGDQDALVFSVMPMNSGTDFKARETDVAQPLVAGAPSFGNQGGDMVMTLASRGRPGGHQLETRDDGLANAVLTPNGGRGGMGVGAVAFAPLAAGKQGSIGYDPESDVTQTMGARQGPPAIAFDTTQITSPDNRSDPREGDPCHPLTASGDAPAITGAAIRRLTPRECERLQGFPDDYTLIPYRKGVAADGPRYAALGNSMAVPVMSWIGRRIALVDAL